jgi:hypothetical protein
MLLLVLLLVVFCSGFIGWLVLFILSAHEFGLKLEIIVGPDCGVDHGIKHLVGDATKYRATHFWA